MADRVKRHTRGGTTVRAHTRRSRPRKALVSPRHSWHLAKRAYRAGKRHKKGLAVTLGVLAVGELGSWFVLDTLGKTLSLAAFLCILGAGAALGATGREA